MAKLTIEMADTPSSLAHGLMHRKDLPNDAGMLFKFPSTQEVNFWGKNTYIPLDVAFIGADSRIMGIKQIVPMSTRRINSGGFCSMAIEANAGFFKENNIEPGHIIEINGDTVEFKNA